MELDPNFHRTIRKKFPRLRYYDEASSYSETPATKPHDAASFRTEYVKQNHNPESQSSFENAGASSLNHISTPTSIHMSTIIRTPSENGEPGPFALERLRSLSPGKSIYEQGGQSITRYGGVPNECTDSLNRRHSLSSQASFSHIPNPGLEENGYHYRMPTPEDTRNQLFENYSETNVRQFTDNISVGSPQNQINPSSFPMCNRQTYLNNPICNRSNAYSSKKDRLQCPKTSFITVGTSDSSESEELCNTFPQSHQHSLCTSKTIFDSCCLSLPSTSKQKVLACNDHTSTRISSGHCTKQSDTHTLVKPDSETIDEARQVAQERENQYFSPLLPKDNRSFRDSIRAIEGTSMPQSSSLSEHAYNMRLSESPRQNKPSPGIEFHDGTRVAYESARCSDLSSCPTSPETIIFSDDSQRFSPPRSEAIRHVNAFQSAHNELLMETPLPASKPSRTPIGDLPELIPLADDKASCDTDYYSDQSTSSSEDEASNIRKDVLPDTSNMSSEAILDLIQEPLLYQPKKTNLNSLSSHLEPHEVGHLNHLIKCYADSLFTIYVPSSPKYSSSATSSAVYIMDIHMCGLMQIYYIMFKSEDFLNLGIHDQEVLLESGILPALISLGIPLYKVHLKGWTLPSLAKDRSPFFLAVVDFNDILPKDVVDRTMLIYELSHKLGIDWTIAMLFLMIFLFTPAKRVVEEEEKIDLIRTNYVKLLLKYLEWKHGPSSASYIFPELLKFMDAILRHCQEIENLHLYLNNEEISAVYEHFRTLNIGSSLFNNEQLEVRDALIKDAVPLGYLSYYSLHSRLSSTLAKCLHMDGNHEHESRPPERSGDLLRTNPPHHTPLNLSPTARILEPGALYH